MKIPLTLVLGILSVCGGQLTLAGGAMPSLDVPRLTNPPVIDGNLNEPAWQKAALIERLKPHRGAVSQDRLRAIPTTVRVAWDENFLYVAFECRDDEIDVDGKARRDSDLFLHDVCEIFLDGMGDGRQYIEVEISPAGQVMDILHLLSAPPEYTGAERLTPLCVARDLWSLREWDMEGLRAASGRIGSHEKVAGWTVEVAIPASSVMRRRGRSTFVPGELRANFIRYDWEREAPSGSRGFTQANWTQVEHGCPHISAAVMGRLNLLP